MHESSRQTRVPVKLYAMPFAGATQGGEPLGLKAAVRLSTGKLVGDVVEQWLLRAKGLTTLVFATSITHSQRICEAFVSNGVKAVHVDSSTPDATRHDIIDKMKSGEITVCCNCGVLIEGADVPNIGCVILAMATRSTSRYLRCVDQGRHPHPDKRALVVLDHGGNHRLHGLPYDVRYMPTAVDPKKFFEVYEQTFTSNDLRDPPFESNLDKLVHRWCEWCVAHGQVTPLKTWMSFTLPGEDCSLIHAAYEAHRLKGASR
jgi:hypothetical protein